MRSRFKNEAVAAEVHRLVNADPLAASSSPEALDIFLGSRVSPTARPNLKHLVFWAPVSPVSALRYFLPAFNQEPLVLQYAMRVLEQHPVDLVFFYVPQVVQALRTDPLRESAIPDVELVIASSDALRPSYAVRRLHGTIHLRDFQDFAALLPPDHLEHESERLQRRPRGSTGSR